MFHMVLLLAGLFTFPISCIFICGKKKKVRNEDKCFRRASKSPAKLTAPVAARVERTERLSIHGSISDDDIKMPDTVCSKVDEVRSQTTQVSNVKPTSEEAEEQGTQKTGGTKSVTRSPTRNSQQHQLRKRSKGQSTADSMAKGVNKTQEESAKQKA